MPSIKKNLIYQISYEVLVMLLPIITSPYVSRVLGAMNIGIYSYTYTIANYFVLFAALGIRNYGNREISRVRDDKVKLNKTFSEILSLHILISLVVVLGDIVYTFTMANQEYKLYSLIFGLYVLGALFDISWLFFGLEQFKTTVTRNTVIKFVSVICIFVFVNNENDLWKYVLILALGNFLSQLYLWAYTGKYVEFTKVTFAGIMRHFPQMALLFIPTIAASLYNYMDKIMLGVISGNTQLGFYDNSEKIVFVVVSVLGSLGTVMLPRMSNLIAQGETQKSKKYINDSMHVVILMASAFTFGIIGISKVFAPVFWGEEFTECSLLISALAITLPIRGFAIVLRTQYLIPSKKDKEYTMSVCSGAVVNIILNLVLITPFQAIGAAIATIAAEGSVCLVQILYCRKELPVISYIKSTAAYVLIGILMGSIVYCIGLVLQPNIKTLCIQIIVGVVLYLIMHAIYFKIKRPKLIIELIRSIKTKRGFISLFGE